MPAILGLAVVMLAWHNIWMSAHGAALAADAKQRRRRDPRWPARMFGAARRRRARRAARRLGDGAVPLRDRSSPAGPHRPRCWRAGLSASPPASRPVTPSMPASCGCRCAGSSPPPACSCCSSPPAWRRRRRAFLIQADVLPSLVEPLWDTSALVPENSVVGTVLRSLVGYDARPAGMQIVFYVAVLVAIASGMLRGHRPAAPRVSRSAMS